MVVWLAPGLTAEQLEALKARRQRVVPSFNSEQVYPGLSAKGERTIVLGEPARAYIPKDVAAQAGSPLKQDLPNFGKAYAAVPLAALCDGSVRALDLTKVSARTLKSAITVAGGEILGGDW